MILQTLADCTRARVAQEKKTVPPELVREKARSLPVGRGTAFFDNLAAQGMSFICEVKRASPSKGMIADHFPYLDIARDYETAGASAISVLTEPEYFKGSDLYLKEIASAVSTPVLRKDFTVDPYQIYQARILGASAVLLICALLDTKTIHDYLGICHDLGLSAIVEAHDEAEVRSALDAGADIIGVNNRNLKDFTVSLDNSLNLRPLVPPEKLFVAESGIKTPDHIRTLEQAGVNAVLIGETLMRAPDKSAMLRELRGH